MKRDQRQFRQFAEESQILLADEMDFAAWNDETESTKEFNLLLKRAVKSIAAPQNLREKVLIKLEFS